MIKYLVEIIISLFVLLGILLFIVFKYCKHKLLRTGLAAVLLLAALYLSILTIDINRVNTLQKPVFAQEFQRFDEIVVYSGIGYKVELIIEDYSGEITHGQLTMFGNLLTIEDAIVYYSRITLMSEKVTNKLLATKKIVLRGFAYEGEDDTMGIITDESAIKEIVKIIANSRQYGSVFTCDGNGLDMDMYDDNGELIDTIFVWVGSERLIPKSIHSGCAYYSTSYSDKLRIETIIEEQTDFVFFNVYYYAEDDGIMGELVYEDENFKYCLSYGKNTEYKIEFLTTDIKKTIKEALDYGYITVEQLLHDNPDLLIKKPK